MSSVPTLSDGRRWHWVSGDASGRQAPELSLDVGGTRAPLWPAARGCPRPVVLPQHIFGTSLGTGTGDDSRPPRPQEETLQEVKMPPGDGAGATGGDQRRPEMTRGAPGGGRCHPRDPGAQVPTAPRPDTLRGTSPGEWGPWGGTRRPQETTKRPLASLPGRPQRADVLEPCPSGAPHEAPPQDRGGRPIINQLIKPCALRLDLNTLFGSSLSGGGVGCLRGWKRQ